MILRIFTSLFLAAILIMMFGCQRDVDLLEPAPNPSFAEVYMDAFVAGLDYSAFANSKLDAFDIDKQEHFKGTSSIRITVPGKDDPSGWFAGGVFFSKFPRDLSGYDALTFWGKADRPARAEIGFGNDNTGNSLYTVMQKNVLFGTSWKKYIIPIPLASKLTAETGMLQYSAGPDANGYGGNIWIDEVKYEKLGTIAYPRPVIADTLIEGEVGDLLDAGVTGVTFNVNGVDQTEDAAPAYFTFISSDESVARATPEGKVSAIGIGTARITVKLGSLEASQKITIKIVEAAPKPATPAPTPAADPDSVISLFSNAYTNVLVDTWNPFWEYSTAEVTDLQIDGNDVKRYTNLNFVGIEFTSQTVDASQMTHFHIDFWTPDPAAGAEFSVKLVDFGADGVFGGGNDSEVEIAITSPQLVSQAWVGVDLPIKGWANRSHVAQLILVGNDNINTVYIDNAYFYIAKEGGGTGNAPTEPAPTPTQAAGDVISLFSNTYADVNVDTWSAEWDQADVSDVQVSGDDVKLYTNLVYAGIEFTSQTIDVSAMDYFHMDIWTPDPTEAPAEFKIKMVDFGSNGVYDGGGDDVEHELIFNAASSPQLVTSSWISFDIPLSNFSGLTTKGHLAQMIISGGLSTVYIDNIYFYNSGGGPATEPDEAAPTPTQSAANVLSIFSDAYTNVASTDFYPNWGQSTVVSEVAVAGNNTLLYIGLNYQGIQLGSSQNVSGMQILHLDVWTANSTALNIYLISTGPAEKPFAVTVPTTGWLSLDIPLTSFSDVVDLSDIIQFKFDGNGDIYLDNLYFYKSGGVSGTEPTQAAPTPTHDAADVFSIFSDAYTDLENSNFNPDWGQSTVQTFEEIAGDNTLKYVALNYQGTNLGSVDGGVPQDVSAYDYLHVDFWTPNATTLNFFVLDQSAGEVSYPLPITNGKWVSVDIPLSHFSGGGENLADIHQFKVDGGDGVSTVVWFDNWYFYKDGGSSGSWTTNDVIDFESSGYGAGWTWNVFENDSNPALEFVSNPDASGANTSSTVAKFTALQAGQPWAGCENAHGELGTTFDLSASNAFIKIMVYKTVISDVGMKLANPAGGAQTEIKVANTKTNEWEELTFDFSDRIGNGLDGSTNIDQIIVFPDFNLNGRTQDNVIYFDNIRFSSN